MVRLVLLSGDDFGAATEPAERPTERDMKVKREARVFSLSLRSKRGLVRILAKVRCSRV